ncbi:MAG: SPOR domain-containing protein [Hyphomonadaceae bacterium]
MRSLLMCYLRFAGFSVAALAVAACAKMASVEGASGRPDPLVGEPPENSEMAVAQDRQGEAQRIAALEAQVADLDSQLVHLRKAVDLLGPLPDHPDLFIPVSKAEITTESMVQDAEANARLAALYSPPPTLNRASSLFYEAELGSFATQSAAEAHWKQLVASNRLGGLEPAYALAGAVTRLTAGPMASQAAVQALCVELSSLAGACRVAAPIRAY